MSYSEIEYKRFNEMPTDVYLWTPGHNKFIIFDDLTKLVIAIIFVVTYVIISKFNVRPKS